LTGHGGITGFETRARQAFSLSPQGCESRALPAAWMARRWTAAYIRMTVCLTLAHDLICTLHSTAVEAEYK